MESLFNFLQSVFPFISENRYIFLFIGSATEGFNVLLLGGFLLSINALEFYKIIPLFLIGGIINGYLWYFLGYFAGSKPLDKWVRKGEKGKAVLAQVEKYFNRYSGRALILTRLTIALTVATLIMAGSIKYNFKKFSLYNFIGAIGWLAITLGVGYFLGEGYKFIFVYIKNLTLVVIIIASLVLLIYVARILLKSAFIRSLFLNQKLVVLGDKMMQKIDNIISGGR